MGNTKIIKIAIQNSSLAAIYVTLIAFTLGNGQKIFADGHKVLIPIFMLLLLVLSAAIMGILVFGKPIMLYLDGAKKEAVKLLSYTIASLAVITLTFSLILMLLK